MRGSTEFEQALIQRQEDSWTESKKIPAPKYSFSQAERHKVGCGELSKAGKQIFSCKEEKICL